MELLNNESNLLKRKFMGQKTNFQYRKDPLFVVQAYGFEIVGINKSGKKLLVRFLDSDENAIEFLDPHLGKMTERYIERSWVEKMANQINQTM